MAAIVGTIRRLFSALAIAGAVIFVSWSAPNLPSGVPVQVYPASSAAPSAAPGQIEERAVDDSPQVSAQTTDSAPDESSSTTTSVVSYRVDPNVFFPPAPGHELARDSCLSCHQLMTFAYVRKTRDGWMRNRVSHAGRMPELSEDQIGVIYEYLSATINHDLPIPAIPSSWVCSS